MNQLFRNIVILLSFLLIGLFLNSNTFHDALDRIYARYELQEDNDVEQVIESIIEHQTGLKIDFTEE